MVVPGDISTLMIWYANFNLNCRFQMSYRFQMKNELSTNQNYISNVLVMDI